MSVFEFSYQIGQFLIPVIILIAWQLYKSFINHRMEIVESSLKELYCVAGPLNSPDKLRKVAKQCEIVHTCARIEGP